MPRTMFLIALLALSSCATVPGAEPMDALITKAEGGDVEAMVRLALRYDSTRTANGRVAAVEWYQRAAEAGFLPALNSVGSLYQEGVGGAPDFIKAREWYERAAAAGDPEGTHNLAFLYDEALGVTEDNAHALALYRSAARNGFARSMLNLGYMYLAGDGVAVDKIEAFKWFDLSRFYTQHTDDQQAKWNSRSALDELRKELGPAGAEQGQRRARAWIDDPDAL